MNYDKMTDSELDAMVAEKVMGLPARVIPDDARDGSCVSHTHPLARDILSRAVASRVVLKQGATYKGTSYVATFDGWALAYVVDDNYRASESITLDGDAELWMHGIDNGVFIAPSTPPDYSTSIADAWAVVDRLRRDDYEPLIRPAGGNEWLCIVNASADPKDETTTWHSDRSYTIHRRRLEVRHLNPARAICLAALKAKEQP